MLRSLLTIMAACFASAALAQAPTATGSPVLGCQVQIKPAPPTWLIYGFDPFSNTTPEGTFSVTFLNQGDDDCMFSPTFELQPPPFGLTDGRRAPIGYALLNLSDSIDVTPRAGRTVISAFTRMIELAPGEARSIMYRLAIDPDALRWSGSFTQQLTLVAQDPNLRSFGAVPITVGIDVLPSARIGLAGAYQVNEGQAFVDLGELRSGVAPVPLNLRVKSTGRYAISVTSANSGFLTLGGSEWRIPYSMIIGGESVNLRGMETVSGNNEDGSRRESLPLQFVIGNTSDRRAGTYSDIISISITAR